MKKSLEIQELVIVIAASNYDPTLLKPSLLKFSGIVPSEWELAQQPVITERASQVIFKNGVSVASQPGRLMFIESLNGDSETEIEAAHTASRYIKSLPNLEYRAVGINFRGYLSFPKEDAAAHKYILETFMTSGSWQTLGTEPVRAEINLTFTLEDKRLLLNINEAELQLPENKKVPVALFTGNFEYDLSKEENPQQKLEEVLQNWNEDKQKYIEVVNKFIKDKIEEKAKVAAAKA